MTHKPTIPCDNCGARLRSIPEKCPHCGEVLRKRMEPNLAEKIAFLLDPSKRIHVTENYLRWSFYLCFILPVVEFVVLEPIPKIARVPLGAAADRMQGATTNAYQ